MTPKKNPSAPTDIAPPYDQWLRLRSGTGAAAIVEEALALVADVRVRPTKPGKAPRKHTPEAQRTLSEVSAALIANIVQQYLLNGGWVRVPLSNKELGAQTRYRSRALSQLLRPVAWGLCACGWLSLIKGERGKQRQAVACAAGPLLKMIAARGASLAEFERDPSEEIIILKGARPSGRDGRGDLLPAEFQPYEDTDETRRMREELHAINEWLTAADITYAQHTTDGEPRLILQAAHPRRLRRVFNNGTFAEGGRLWGGFWQNASKELKPGELWRGGIRIEGEPVATVDYSSAFLRLLYVEAGVQPPKGDLYGGIEGFGPEHREGIKQLVNTMLFQDGELKRVPMGTRSKDGELLDKLPEGLSAKAMAEAIKRRHVPVAHLFGTNIGPRLFRRESDVLLEVLKRCKAQSIVALPLHDAVLVRESAGQEAKRVMLKVFREVTGFKGEATVKSDSCRV